MAVTEMGEKVTNSPSSAPQKKKKQQHHPPTAGTTQTSGSLSRSSSADAEEAAEYATKYRIYERDYLRRINHKYFSGKNLAGTGRVFETVSTVDGFTLKESREKPIKRFLELSSASEEHHKGDLYYLSEDPS
ncbi:hypothetical protein R1flu_000877 [Riccia fluitans]|uniref:Uncharacterized protein n=1 Tax=Riccia fluitans TaxID=41844 RepID=A0ABD1Y4V2_9MARC